jgi:hypothetical protein
MEKNTTDGAIQDYLKMLVDKKYLNSPDGTTLRQFDHDLRNAVHVTLLQGNLEFDKTLPQAGSDQIKMQVERNFNNARVKIEFDFRFDHSTRSLQLIAMAMDVPDKATLLIKFDQETGLPTADKAYFLATGEQIKRSATRQPAKIIPRQPGKSKGL